jgi:hypothetical protein
MGPIRLIYLTPRIRPAPVSEFVLLDIMPKHLEEVGQIYACPAMEAALYAPIIQVHASSALLVISCLGVLVYLHVQMVLLKAILLDMDFVLIVMWSVLV